MRLIQTIRGDGFIVQPNGEERATRYELQIYESQISARHQGDPTASFPGLKSIRGHVSAVHWFGVDGLVLRMEDGRKLRFHFKNSGGSIWANGGFE